MKRLSLRYAENQYNKLYCNLIATDYRLTKRHAYKFCTYVLTKLYINKQKPRDINTLVQLSKTMYPNKI